MYKDLGHCFVDLRWKAKDTVLIFSVTNSADEVRCIALSSSALLTALEVQKHRQPEVNVVRWKLFSAAVVTKETINSQQFSRPAAKMKAQSRSSTQAESVKNLLINFD